VEVTSVPDLTTPGRLEAAQAGGFET
jgi:hypothetical protein